MIYWLSQPVSSQGIAEALQLAHQGDETSVVAVAPLNERQEGVVTFATSPVVCGCPQGLIIASNVDLPHASWLRSEKPRLDFIKLLMWLKEQQLFPVEASGHIDPTALVHETAIVEPGAIIGPGCQIGAHSHISDHVVLGSGVRVGMGVVIGHDGFGYERDLNGRALHFPHLGKVTVVDDVTIGNQCSVARGVLCDTEIGSGVRVDDQAYIAHNVVIEPEALIMSGVRLNGRAHVEAGAWLGTGALVREGCRIGRSAVVGMGSVVIKDVNAETTVAGNPARVLRDLTSQVGEA